MPVPADSAARACPLQAVHPVHNKMGKANNVIRWVLLKQGVFMAFLVQVGSEELRLGHFLGIVARKNSNICVAD